MHRFVNIFFPEFDDVYRAMEHREYDLAFQLLETLELEDSNLPHRDVLHGDILLGRISMGANTELWKLALAHYEVANNKADINYKLYSQAYYIHLEHYLNNNIKDLDVSTFYKNVGFWFQETPHYEYAIESYSKGIFTNTTDSGLYESRSLNLFLLSQSTRVLIIAPECSQTYRTRAYSDASRSLLLEPNSMMSLRIQANCLKIEQKYLDALRVSKRIYSMDPSEENLKFRRVCEKEIRDYIDEIESRLSCTSMDIWQLIEDPKVVSLLKKPSMRRILNHIASNPSILDAYLAKSYRIRKSLFKIFNAVLPEFKQYYQMIQELKESS